MGASQKFILLTNDDGIESQGLEILATELKVLAEVFVVAPLSERSGAGHSFSSGRAVRARRLRRNVVGIDGTPTDCVMFAVRHILARRPDLVVSGINKGPNLGDDVTYSGTVGAALEGALLGIPAFAVSLSGRDNYQFGEAADFARYLAGVVLDRGLPPRLFLNVNVPVGIPRGVSVTRQGRRVYRDRVEESRDPNGDVYYSLRGEEPGGVWEEGTDLEAIKNNMISITPLDADLTGETLMEELRGWNLDLEGARAGGANGEGERG